MREFIREFLELLKVERGLANNSILSYKRESFRKAIHMLTIVIPILYMILDKIDMMIFMVVISVLMLLIDFYRRSDNNI